MAVKHDSNLNVGCLAAVASKPLASSSFAPRICLEEQPPIRRQEGKSVGLRHLCLLESPTVEQARPVINCGYIVQRKDVSSGVVASWRVGFLAEGANRATSALAVILVSLSRYLMHKSPQY